MLLALQKKHANDENGRQIGFIMELFDSQAEESLENENNDDEEEDDFTYDDNDDNEDEHTMTEEEETLASKPQQLVGEELLCRAYLAGHVCCFYSILIG